VGRTGVGFINSFKIFGRSFRQKSTFRIDFRPKLRFRISLRQKQKWVHRKKTIFTAVKKKNDKFCDFPPSL
jgi:hypothetical protein